MAGAAVARSGEDVGAGSGGGFDALVDERSVLVTTFRRDGRAVATPVWHVVWPGRVCFSTPASTGEVQRLWRETRVTMTAYDRKGAPHGPTFDGRARFVDGAAAADIQAALAPLRIPEAVRRPVLPAQADRTASPIGRCARRTNPLSWSNGAVGRDVRGRRFAAGHRRPGRFRAVFGGAVIIEYIRYTVDAARRDTFEAAYADAQAALAASAHCLGWELSRCTEEPTSYVLRIEWDSLDGHLEGFRRSAEFRTFFAAVRPFVGDIAEMRHYEATAVRSTAAGLSPGDS
jgi:PPOX class probable F420-dependent enzyme